MIFPDISGALDGTVPDRWIPTTYGGTTIDDIRYARRRRASPSRSASTCARRPSASRELAGVEYALFRQLHGLKAVDRFVALLAELSGRPAPASDPPPAGAVAGRAARRPLPLFRQADCDRRRARPALRARDLLRRHGRRDPGRGHDDRPLEDPRARAVRQRSRSAISATSRSSPKAPTCSSPTATAARPPSASASR